MINHNKLKWHNIKMQCVKNGCPNIQVQPGRSLSDVLKDVCSITSKANMPVTTDFHGGFVIPAGTEYHDAYFMALEQTDTCSPQDRLAEAQMIKQVAPNFEFDEDLKLSLAYYRHEVLKENPQNINQFTEEDVLDTFKILNKMKNDEYKVTLPLLEKELQTKYPQTYTALQQKEQQPTQYNGFTR